VLAAAGSPKKPGRCAVTLPGGAFVGRYGPGLPVPYLRRILAANYPNMIRGKPHDVRGVFGRCVPARSVDREPRVSGVCPRANRSVWAIFKISRRRFDPFPIPHTAPCWSCPVYRFIADGNPSAGSDAPDAAGNGSLVRLAPLAILYPGDAKAARFEARKQSRTTHAAQECLDACALFVSQLVDALTGADKEAATGPRVMSLTAHLLFISGGDWKTKTREQIHSSGCVVHTMEAALWSVWQTDNFRDAVLTAANLGDDADSVAAVAGQLAGALYGASGIPKEWLAKLAWRDKIEALANALFERRGAAIA
jgi:hypothetical protein